MITHKTCAVSKTGTVRLISPLKPAIPAYSGLTKIRTRQRSRRQYK
ncbi:hypothetical protein M5006_08410 [Neisseria meningitidis]|nr:hypothetical protein [Neisseria meningitidis]MCL5855072.1 hypothetical protein [Neisseria meningitidis]MCL6059849.1 hypothetical protein [Neisseria meningitidis]